MSSRRPYFSERHGRGPRSQPLTTDALRKLVFNVWDALMGKDYFQEAFGYDCVDAGTVPGTVGTDPEAYFIRVLGREHMWPYRNADTVFETVYDRMPSST